MTRIQELHKNLSEAEYELQEAERTIRDMQDKIGKLRVAWDDLHPVAHAANCDCKHCAVDRPLRELEK